jgi:subtilase family serine protease
LRRLIPAALGAVALAALSLAPAGAASAGSAAPKPILGPDGTISVATNADDPLACSRPDNQKLGLSAPFIHCYTPNQIREFYGLSDLTPQTTDGAGQTIVLVDSYGSPTAVADVEHFASTFSGPAPDVSTVFPLGHPDYKNPPGQGSGTSGPTAADGWAGEANLDVQWAYAIAPKAHIVLLAAPPAETQGVQGLPNLMKAIDWAIATYPAGTVFSMSFGTDESEFAGSSARQQFAKFDQTFQRGLAKHDTFFSSSGDEGSLGASRAHHQSQPLDHPAVSYPNVSPYVTSVGGTQVQSGWTWNPTSDVPFIDADVPYNPAYFAWDEGGSSEAVWNESWEGIGTGGGMSSVYSRPGFQDDVADVVGDHRGVPDVAWNAAVNGGVLVYISYFPRIEGPPRWGVFGGTSASSPQVAALTAIANQSRAADSKAGIGNLDQVIYGPGFDRSAAFSDIVPQTYGTAASGVLKDNQMWEFGPDGMTVQRVSVDGYPTTTGYDLTTGWGSPKAGAYIAQLTAAP